ncbi:hypothetical protein GTY75_31400 [Streptomyces sp. SID8381]|uniref:hypothetical protein n=1 Tax=unclassified Streptomyces TaxID=2593676 RepID=UPI00035EA4D8|nr:MULTISPECIES: hypothetical protein [unclassified Streptomyces]MYX31075.1 hypothetical protein [Streptomyces sp. SID8381]
MYPASAIGKPSLSVPPYWVKPSSQLTPPAVETCRVRVAGSFCGMSTEVPLKPPGSQPTTLTEPDLPRAGAPSRVFTVAGSPVL